MYTFNQLAPNGAFTQFLFLKGSLEYLELEPLFHKGHFIFIDKTCTYLTDKEYGLNLLAFLKRVNSREVHWLIYIPATDYLLKLFEDYSNKIVNASTPIDPQGYEDIDLIYISNYPLET